MYWPRFTSWRGIQVQLYLPPSLATFVRFRLNKLQLKQVLRVFDPENNGSVDGMEFAKFCLCADVAEAVRLALQLQEEAAKNKKFSEHELYVSCAHDKGGAVTMGTET